MTNFGINFDETITSPDGERIILVNEMTIHSMCMGSLIARGHSIIYDERMEKKSIFTKTELLHMLGPGIITGALMTIRPASQHTLVSAAFGTQLLWTSIFASPL